MHEIIESLLGQMTLQEKVSLLAGSDFWHTTPVERLGIPRLKVTDGPNGARGGGNFVNGVKAACFPVGISLASTWNTELVTRVGQALAQEARSKGAQVLLAPTVNIHRTPLSGRNFECYSEDPYLTARMAVAYITGVQSRGIGATVKHYICNDSEFQRNSISSEVGERALREIYLPPFKAAIEEARSWAIMASYNKVNGTFASENATTLTEILRKEMKFDGLVMSDWFGTQSTAPSVNAGLDLEMPGPPLWRGEKLLHAVEMGEVQEATIDERVRAVLHLLLKAGKFEQREEKDEQAIDHPEHRAIAREAAAEGIVLLKNERSVLPLQREQLTSLAIIGPNAKTARIMGGGSAQVNAHYAITPFDGIVAKLDERVKVGYELGCSNDKLLPLLDVSQILAGNAGTEQGFATTYFNSADLSGNPVWTERNTIAEFQWLGGLDYPEAVDPGQFSFRGTARFTAHETGAYTFGLVSAGLSQFLLDGQEIIDNWTQQTIGDIYFGMGSTEVSVVVEMEAEHTYVITLEYSKGESPLAAVRLGCLAPRPADEMDRAVSLAAASDVALVFVGLTGEWESESFDRPNMDLVGEQNELVERVAAANKNTVVVLNTGSPITMPWLERVAAVLQAWYPGQECGNAIADVLFGDTTPSGKLPQTFPMRLEDTPAYLHYPGEHGRVYYHEGIFVGYRYYEKRKIEPLFPFGFGLSYTTFSYGPLTLSKRQVSVGDTIEGTIEVANTGMRPGKEVLQVYLRDVKSSLLRPEKELKAFAKVSLTPGERKAVTFSIPSDALAYYDDVLHKWVAEAGEFEVLVGASSQDIRATASFTLTTSGR